MSDLETRITELCEQYDPKSVIYMLEKVLRPQLLKTDPRVIPCLQDAYRLFKKAGPGETA